MKTARIISIFLSLIIIISSLSSCANPVGESSTNTTSPTPADTAVTETKETTETAAVTAAPIDLSVLTKDERAKLQMGLIGKLNSISSDKIEVVVFLKPIMTEQEYDAKVEAQMEINEETYAELTAKLEALYIQKNELIASSDTKAETTSLDKQIVDLENERAKYQYGYGFAANIVLDKNHTPVLKAFAKKHGFPSETFISAASMRLGKILITKDKVIDLAKDDEVRAITPPEDISNIKPFVYSPTYATNTSRTIPNTDVDTAKLNEVYNIINGEISVNAGYGGAGVTVGIVDIGVPDQNIVPGVIYVGSSNTNAGLHATDVAKIIDKMAPHCTIVASSTAVSGGLVQALRQMTSL